MQVCSEEADVEKRLKKTCTVPVNLFWGSTLYHIDHGTTDQLHSSPACTMLSFLLVRTVLRVFGSVKHIPDVYTQFRKRMEDVRLQPLLSPSRLVYVLDGS
jgi:hypothetical protein